MGLQLIVRPFVCGEGSRPYRVELQLVSRKNKLLVKGRILECLLGLGCDAKALIFLVNKDVSPVFERST